MLQYLGTSWKVRISVSKYAPLTVLLLQMATAIRPGPEKMTEKTFIEINFSLWCLKETKQNSICCCPEKASIKYEIRILLVGSISAFCRMTWKPATSCWVNALLNHIGTNKIYYIGALGVLGWLTHGSGSWFHFQGQLYKFGAGLGLSQTPSGNPQSSYFTLLFSLEQPLSGCFSCCCVALLSPWSVNYTDCMHTSWLVKGLLFASEIHHFCLN